MMAQSSQGYLNCGRSEVTCFVLGMFPRYHVTFFLSFFVLTVKRARKMLQKESNYIALLCLLII